MVKGEDTISVGRCPHTSSRSYLKRGYQRPFRVEGLRKGNPREFVDLVPVRHRLSLDAFLLWLSSQRQQIGKNSGNRVVYSVSDRVLFNCLDVVADISSDRLVGGREMLEGMKEERRRK